MAECKFCKGTPAILTNVTAYGCLAHVVIENGRLELALCDLKSDAANIIESVSRIYLCYCPICGRKLLQERMDDHGNQMDV